MSLDAEGYLSGNSSSSVDALARTVAVALRIPIEAVTDDLSYRDVAEWDSLAHVRLMLEIEGQHGVEITSERVIDLTSVRAIRAFLGVAVFGDSDTPTSEERGQSIEDSGGTAVVHRGLAGVYFDRTTITSVDAAGDRLRYRGYSVDELAHRTDFEETAFLLIHGHCPNGVEMAHYRDALRSARMLPDRGKDVAAAMASHSPFFALQAGVVSLADIEAEAPGPDVRALAQVPAFIAAHHRLRSGDVPLEPNPELGHAANYLFLLNGTVPAPEAASALEETFVILADHGSSASTFTARVAASTNAPLSAALSSAIGSFSGALHGGAVDQIISMAEAIGAPEKAAGYVQERLARGEVVYGFGHRVYRTADPRSFRLREIASELSSTNRHLLDILEAVPRALMDRARLGMDVNVDFYASAVFEALQIPRDLFGPTFMVARIAGLIAHFNEQRSNNVLIRPQLLYTGAVARNLEREEAAS